MTSSKTSIKISNAEPIKKFKRYIKANERIFLSARFGDGKTTFLNEFRANTQNLYEYITLYPVNYQVAENKDIFEYIKRDILLQLLSIEDLLLDSLKIDNSLALYNYFDTNKVGLIRDLLVSGCNFIPGGNAIAKAIKKLAVHISQFNVTQEALSMNEEDTIVTYIDSFDGGPYEFDPLSQLIFSLINRYKEIHKKEIVLVVEDLDRIDPKHLFRIMNIFSAHIDRPFKTLKEEANTSNNKFNFDKIIFVCHYENIECIFKHFYGRETDFKGYITKFTTTNPFKYSLAAEIEEHISSLTAKLIPELDKSILKWFASQVRQKYSSDSNSKDNLRSIDQKIRYLSFGFEKTILRKEDDSQNLAIQIDNPLSRLLCIAEKFNIDLTELAKSNGLQSTFYDLIGVCWILHPDIEILQNNQFKIRQSKSSNMYHCDLLEIKAINKQMIVTSISKNSISTIISETYLRESEQVQIVIKKIKETCGIE